MRRNTLSLILPNKQRRRRDSLMSSLSSTRSYHIVQSATQDDSNNESFIDDNDYSSSNHPNLFKRRKSSVQCAQYVVIEYSSNSNRSTEQLIRAGTCLTTNHLNNHNHNQSLIYHGETLIHLSSRLGHEHILRRLIQETPYATRLTNAKGQTPLLCAIQSSYSSTALFLMDIDPITITVSDKYFNSVFHYATYLSNDRILSRALLLIQRLNSPHLKAQALSRLIERNIDSKSPFLISIEKESIRCNRLFFCQKSILNNNVDLSLYLNNESVCYAIDHDRIDLIQYWLEDWNRFDLLLKIEIKDLWNILEYSIENEKILLVRLFLTQNIPWDKDLIKIEYKLFLNHFNLNDKLTPIQRLFNRTNLIHLIPLLLDQFLIGNNGADLTIIDDCLNNCPKENQCLFGHQSNLNCWSKQSWLNEHPLKIIGDISEKSIDDHSIVRLCVDLKYQLFGNILYLVIALTQIIYVILYTSVLLFSPSLSINNMNYYSLINQTCHQMCFQLINHSSQFYQHDYFNIRLFRIFLLLISCLTLFKEAFQMLIEKNKYFQKLFINLLEIHMYISGIIYALDFNECTRQTGIRCHMQWQIGAIGLLSVWTSLLLVLMKGIECGKHGLLFIKVLLNFVKLIFCYIFIWIGFYLALYTLLKDIYPQFNSFYFIPKLLVMFIGEYDLDSTFFPNNVFIKGSEGALFVYSAFIFTMFIVMSNIMGGLAVADVKEFRLNAKREHLRARIETILQVQTNFGFLCELCSKLVLKSFHKYSFIRHLFKYDLSRLEIKTTMNNFNMGIISSSTLFQSTNLKKISKLNEQLYLNETNLLIKNQKDFKEYFEDSTFHINNQLRKILLQLRTEIDELKTYFDQHLSK